jgi:hypothetical protein
MNLTWHDAAATLLTGAAAGLYAAHVAEADLPLAANSRVVALAVLLLGLTACGVGGSGAPRDDTGRTAGVLTVFTVLGWTALATGVAALVTGGEPLLAGLVGLTALLWLGATVRHALVRHTATRRVAGPDGRPAGPHVSARR